MASGVASKVGQDHIVHTRYEIKLDAKPILESLRPPRYGRAATEVSNNSSLIPHQGNDPDEDGQPTVPVIPVEKPTQRTGKRNAGDEKVTKEPPTAPRGGGRGGRGGRRGDFTGNERGQHTLRSANG